MKYRYGYFNEDGSEFIITDPRTPRAFDNFLWNDAVFSNVSQTGTGYFDYQYDGKKAIQLFTGVGRICDFDVFGRDHLMSRLIYIRDNDTGEYWNVNWEPVKKEYESYECRQGMGYMIISSKTCGISSEFRIFVPSGKDPVELWTLKTRNETDKKRNLSIFVYNQFQFKFKWGFDSYGDMIYRTSWFNRDLNAIYDDTIIIFTSDHGDYLGDFGMIGKKEFYEPAVHIPLIVSHPDKRERKTVSSIVSLTDLFSTILSMAGLPYDENNGDSIVLPELNDKDKAREYLFAPSLAGFMVAKGPYKYCRYYNGVNVLFDIEKDPREQTNLIDDPSYRDVVKELDQIMIEEIFRSILAANEDKVVNRGGISGEGPFGERGWKRTYPSKGGFVIRL